MPNLDSISPLVALVLVVASCSRESSELEPPALVATASEQTVDEGIVEHPRWPDVEFFIRRHASGGRVGVFGRCSLKDRMPGMTVIGHSARLGDGGNEYGAKWRWLGRARGGDRYAVEVTVSGSGLSTVHETEVVYSGERLVAFRDEKWVVGAGPPGAEQKRGR